MTCEMCGGAGMVQCSPTCIEDGHDAYCTLCKPRTPLNSDTFRPIRKGKVSSATLARTLAQTDWPPGIRAVLEAMYERRLQAENEERSAA